MRVVEALRDDHDVCIACPSAGPLAEAVDGAGVPRLRLPKVDASLRLHPVQTPVGLGQLAAGGVALARAARRFRAEVIHANTPRAGIMGAVARRLGGPPVVVRAHEHVPLTPVGRAARALILRTASAVVAVSDYTARKFNEGLAHPVATRVYNSIDHDRFDPGRVRPAALREELGLRQGAALLGHVAQITPWKAQDTAIRAVSELRRCGLDVHLVLVGGIAFPAGAARYDNHAYLRHLHRLVDELSVGHAVHFLGHRADVPQILLALDMSLLPSWEEPCGYVMLESLALGTPVLVTEVGGGREVVENGVSGRLLPPRRPEVWAAAARELLEDPRTLQSMGERGPIVAARFSDAVYAREMLAVYERAAAGRPGPSVARAVGSEDGAGARWPS
jgi:glycosyltransferase involved in cell wall biosynthesis